MDRYSEQQVREAVADSRSLSEALRKLGLRPAGGNHRTLRRLIARYGIPTDHLDPNWALRYDRPRTATPLVEVLVEGSTYSRRRLKQRRCELCGQDEWWRGHRIGLILDHINGEPADNRLENLRIVCPNCAATLETHCGRKNRIDFGVRLCIHCGAEFEPKYPTHRYCSQACGVRSKGPREPRPERRQVQRPAYDQLMIDVATMSLRAIGRKYGVSDNAVRKWIRWYERDVATARPSGPETEKRPMDEAQDEAA